MSEAGQTTLGCPENALTRLLSRRPLERSSSHQGRARQRGFCPSRRLRRADEIASAGDDPVNEADPSGDASQGGPPAPTPSATSYDYSFDLGTLGSPTTIATFVHEDCANVFPISGCDDNFRQGEDMLLQERLLFGVYTQSFPVEVKTVASTYFSFVALPGHPEGQGRRITFSFTQATCQDLYLHVYTSKNGSALTHWFGLRTVDFWIAHETWAEFASNIEETYPWWAERNSTGPPTPV